LSLLVPFALGMVLNCEEKVMMLYVIDTLAALFVLAGFHLAFRQKRVRAWAVRLRQAGGLSNAVSHAQGASEDPEGVASVFRMAGVMIMAFSFTLAAFANLIAYYTAATRI
jgi:hypothetical protein